MVVEKFVGIERETLRHHGRACLRERRIRGRSDGPGSGAWMPEYPERVLA